MIEILFVLGNGIIVAPWFGNHDHQCQRQIHAAHIHEFKCVVDHGRIRSVIIDHRIYSVNIRFTQSRMHGLLTRQHPVMVPGNCVDFSVMGNHTVRMGAVPARIGIGGKTGMDNCDCRFKVLRLQVLIEHTQLADKKHSLIHDGPG